MLSAIATGISVSDAGRVLFTYCTTGTSAMDDDNRYSIREFVEQTVQQDRGQGLFELESDRILEVNLNGQVWTKMGSMIAYRGDVKFTRDGVLEHGLGKMLK